MKAKFHIPDIWVHKDLNLYLIDMIKNHPEFFYDDIEIASCYGCALERWARPWRSGA